MAPTEGRVARPERWWGCRRGTPLEGWKRKERGMRSDMGRERIRQGIMGIATPRATVQN